MASWEKRRCSTLLALYSVATLLILKGIEAKEFIVGNQMGWTNYDLKTFEVPNYADWATSQRVTVGDFVVFKYAKGMHNVNQLPNREAYLGCDFSRATLLDAGETGLYTWRARKAGVYYFGCNKEVEEEGNHCGSGQKLALLVGGAAIAPTPASQREAAPPLSTKAPPSKSSTSPHSATSSATLILPNTSSSKVGAYTIATVAVMWWLLR